MSDVPIYLDFAATTPVDRRVADLIVRYMCDDFGNAGSRTHVFGAEAQRAVQQSREMLASATLADPADICFTSGATEANNLALQGLAAGAAATGRRHIISSAIEHKSVLEPLRWLETQGFAVTLVAPDSSGRVAADDVLGAIRADTLAVSVMQANNETGVVQPLTELARDLPEEVFLHTDAAQSFSKLKDPVPPRVDLISVSGHKLFGPKGIGALIVRRRSRRRAPIHPIMFGGGQERGLRPGTLPVPLVVGLGEAVRLALDEGTTRRAYCETLGAEFVSGLQSIGATINGSRELRLPHILNVAIPNLSSEAAMIGLRSVAAVSNGSACTSTDYSPSHVLTAMGLSDQRIDQSVRLSWSHITPPHVVPAVIARLRDLL